MTTELRESMNLLGSELNVMLAHWISYINAEYDPTGRQSAIVFVDQDGDYNLRKSKSFNISLFQVCLKRNILSQKSDRE